MKSILPIKSSSFYYYVLIMPCILSEILFSVNVNDLLFQCLISLIKQQDHFIIVITIFRSRWPHYHRTCFFFLNLQYKQKMSSIPAAACACRRCTKHCFHRTYRSFCIGKSNSHLITDWNGLSNSCP